MSAFNQVPVSIIVGMRNSATTIIPCLEGLVSQRYPISEVIVVDNVSSDGSVELVESFSKRSPVPVRVVRQSVNGGLATSYNTGAAMAISPLLVLAHSDGAFPSVHELEKLVEPVLSDDTVSASCPFLLMPRDVWVRYPFWQKRLFVRAVDQEVSSFCGKFDCVRKDFFLNIGGFNTARFTSDCGYGGEDSDFLHRILMHGRLIRSEARVIHLHDLSNSFGLGSLLSTRKMLGRTYGKIVRFQGMSLNDGRALFLLRPFLALLPLLPHLFAWGLFLQMLFSVYNSNAMYRTKATLSDPRILLLPLVDIFLIYYEAFWFVEGVCTRPAGAIHQA